MKSEIDHQLTKEEKVVLEMYRNPKNSDIRKLTRLSIQYTIGTGIFLWLAIFLNQPLYSIAIFATFLAFLVTQIYGAKKIAGIMPNIIEKYENTIKSLQQEK